MCVSVCVYIPCNRVSVVKSSLTTCTNIRFIVGNDESNVCASDQATLS